MEKINLKIGGLNCILSVDNPHWQEFLLGKYKRFLNEKDNSKSELTISIHPSKRRKKFLIRNANTITNWRSVFLDCPDSLKFFKRFNFFFKAIYSRVLVDNNGFLLHASSLVKSGRGYIFSGKKGAGKSTIVELSSQDYPLNDDLAIIRKEDKKYFLFASPFYEKNKVDCDNIKVPINGVYCLQQAPFAKVKRLSLRESISYLLPQMLTFPFIPYTHLGSLANCPKETEDLLTILTSLCYSFCNQTKIYRLWFSRKSSFWRSIEKNN